MLMVKHRSLQQAAVFQVQNYVRSERWIGIVTLTTIESELLKVRPEFDQFVQWLRIAATYEQTALAAVAPYNRRDGVGERALSCKGASLPFETDHRFTWHLNRDKESATTR